MDNGFEAPGLEYVMTAHLQMVPNSLVKVPELPSGGQRWSINVAGGRFEGPELNGRVLPGGIENPHFRDDNVLMINARWLLETDDGVPIYVQNRGIRRGLDGDEAMIDWLRQGPPRPASDFYFRVAPTFDAPRGKYDWLTRHLFVGMLVDAPAEPGVQLRGPSMAYFRVL